MSAPTVTPSRNDPCPCGSRKKFKRCHALAGWFAREEQIAIYRARSEEEARVQNRVMLEARNEASITHRGRRVSGLTLAALLAAGPTVLR